ncbi:MAG: DMT family transporter [Rhodobacteraceae bacterium]|nr:DMT family transporter [Paracoccaceae bacterium]
MGDRTGRQGVTTFPEVSPIRGRRVAANLACVTSMVIWAIGFPVADDLLKTLPPLVVVGFRTVLGSFALLPIWWLLEGWHAIRRADWRTGLWIGALGFGTGTAALIYAQKLTDGITVSVILATMPLAAIALECLLDGRRLGWRLVAGVVLSLIGGIAVYALRMGTFQPGLGAGFALLSVLGFAWGSRATVLSLPGHSAIGRTAITLIGAGLAVGGALLLSTLLTGRPIPWAAMGAKEWIYILIYGVGSMALSQTFFIIGVAGLGIAIASMHLNIAPFYVMLFSLAFGASWDWWQVLAAAVVVAGVALAQTGEVRRAP